MANDRVVLFVCQHGAAKSVLASELLAQHAAALDLPLTARSAGVEPDATVSDRLIELFPERAWELAGRQPRRVTGEDIRDASITITFNVPPGELPAPPAELLTWDDVPPVSDDPIAARATVERHIEALLERLGG